MIGIELFTKGRYFALLAVDDVEFPSDETADVWLLYIVAGMDGLEEFLKEAFEVTLVESSDGVAVFAVGLTFFKHLGYQGLVIISMSKIYYLCPDEDVALSQWRF